MDKGISIITIVLLVLTFCFGDNFFDKFSSPEMTISTSKFEIKNNSNDNKKHELNLYRQVTISNIGTKPSFDINVLLNLDGSIYDHEVSSIDPYVVTSIKDSSLKFSMPRLTKGASITLKLWMRSGNNDFKVQATDNQEAIEFISYEQANKKITIIQYASIALLFPLSIYICYVFIYKPLARDYGYILASHQELLEKYSLIDTEKHDLELKVDELTQNESRTNIVEDLAEFLRKHN
jgi:hypothetical protein